MLTSISGEPGWTAVVSEDGHTHIWRNACVGGLLSTIKIGRLMVEHGMGKCMMIHEGWKPPSFVLTRIQTNDVFS